MTETTPTPNGWIHWADFQSRFQELSIDPNFKKAMQPIGYSLLGLLREAQNHAGLQQSHLDFNTPPVGLLVKLGEGRSERTGEDLWSASCFLYPETTQWATKGMAGRYAREGLNFWVQVPRNSEPHEAFRLVLQNNDRRAGFQLLLMSIPAHLEPMLFFNSEVLKWKGTDIQLPSESKYIPITLENERLIAELLAIYARAEGASRWIDVSMSVPADELEKPKSTVFQAVAGVLRHLENIIAFIVASCAEVEEQALLHASTERPPVVEEAPAPEPEPVPTASTVVIEREERVELSPLAQEIVRVMNFTRNVMLYGPPGTGKTHVINQVKGHLLAVKKSPPVSQTATTVDVSGLARWQVVALTMYRAGAFFEQPLNNADINNAQPLKDYETLKGIKSSYGSVQTTLIARAADENGQPAYPKYATSPLVFSRMGNGWFLTAEGKKYVETQLSKYLVANTGVQYHPPYKIKDRFCFTTFHQAFSYEEFMEGFRPVQTSGEDASGFALQDGVFKEFCLRASRELEEAQKEGREPLKFLMVIDEINRANIAKVFGELITLLEDDKRTGAKNPHEVTLPYSKTSFGVPSNLYLLATMNTADRSIALLDVALRRRFTFIECLPDPEILSTNVEFENISISLRTLLTEMNTRITGLLDRDHQIGHAYLTSVSGPEELQYTWYYKIIPLLQEYFYNDGAKLHGLIGNFIVLDKGSTGDIFGFSGRTRQPYMVNTKLRSPEALPDFMAELSKLVARWKPQKTEGGPLSPEPSEQGSEILEAQD